MKMMMVALMATVFATPALAQARSAGPDAAPDGGRGVYVAVHGGLASISDPKGTFFGPADTSGGADPIDTIGIKFHAKDAASVGGTLGYDFGPVRFDVDVTYNRNKLDGITIRDVNGTALGGLTDADAQDFCDYFGADDGSAFVDADDTSVGGSNDCTIRNGNEIRTSGSFAKLRQIGVIASLWYDIPLHSRIVPYVGGGIGATGYHIETPGDGDGKVRFAFQVGAGVAFNLTPRVALTADYRYRHVGGTTLFADDDIGSGFRMKGIGTSLFSGGVRLAF